MPIEHVTTGICVQKVFVFWSDGGLLTGEAVSISVSNMLIEMPALYECAAETRHLGDVAERSPRRPK